MYVGVLPACVSVHYVCSAQEAIRGHHILQNWSCRRLLALMCWELNLGPLQEYLVFLTALVNCSRGPLCNFLGLKVTAYL